MNKHNGNSHWADTDPPSVGIRSLTQPQTLTQEIHKRDNLEREKNRRKREKKNKKKKLGLTKEPETNSTITTTRAPKNEQASSLMRSVPVVNNSHHNEKDRNATLPTKVHTKRNYNMKQREEKNK